MKKIEKLVLMLCLILLEASCYANSVDRTKGTTDGIPIGVIQKSIHGSSDKSGSFVSTIIGHTLTVAFTENLGQVLVEVTTATGAPVDCISTQTPNGVNVYIPLAGDYIVTFTLPNGDEYYGEFTVTD